MERIFYLLKQSLFVKLALVATLVIGGGNSVWGDTVIFDGTTQSIQGWTVSGMKFKTYSTPYWIYIDGTGGTITSDNSIKISSTQKLVIEAAYRGTMSTQIPQIVVRYSIDNVDYNVAATYSTKDKIPASKVELSTDIIGDYRIQLVCDYVYIYSIKIVDTNPFPAPTDFVVSSVNASSATFSWTVGNDETAWQLAYSADENFTPGTEGTILDITSNPYTLSELTTGTTYYAAIRANYGDGDYSEWTDKLNFIPAEELEFLVYDGTNINSLAPINGNRVKDVTYSQLIVPSTVIDDNMKNRQITKLTFYAKESSVSWGSATFEVYLKKTSSNAFPTTDYSLESWGTNVYNNASLSVSDGKMVVAFDTPYNYTDGNILIGIKQITAGTNSAVSWYGSDTYIGGIGLNQYSSSKTRVSYPRKVKFTTVPITSAYAKIGSTGYTTFASAWPLDMTNLPSDLSVYYVAQGDVDDSSVKLTAATGTVAAGEGLILKGTAGQTYAIPVAESGEAISGNMMVGCTTETTLTANSAYYVLVNNDGTPEFQCLDVNGATIPAGKAYLNAPAAGARLKFVFDDDNTTTGISNLGNVHRMMDRGTYNLNGQRVDARQKGVYIVNGKKVVVK